MVSPGHLHCFSIQGDPYVSTLPQTEKGEHTGKSASLSCKKSYSKTLMLHNSKLLESNFVINAVQCQWSVLSSYPQDINR